MPRRRKNPVILSEDDRGSLEGMINRGHAPARQLTHARILLKVDEGEDAPGEAWPDVKITDALQLSRSTLSRVRERFVAEGLEATLLHRRPRRTKPKKLDGSQEAHLIALACSEPAPSRRRAKSAGAFGFWPIGSSGWSAPKSPSPESWSGAL